MGDGGARHDTEFSGKRKSAGLSGRGTDSEQDQGGNIIDAGGLTGCGGKSLVLFVCLPALPYAVISTVTSYMVCMPGRLFMGFLLLLSIASPLLPNPIAIPSLIGQCT